MTLTELLDQIADGRIVDVANIRKKMVLDLVFKTRAQ